MRLGCTPSRRYFGVVHGTSVGLEIDSSTSGIVEALVDVQRSAFGTLRCSGGVSHIPRGVYFRDLLQALSFLVAVRSHMRALAFGPPIVRNYVDWKRWQRSLVLHSQVKLDHSGSFTLFFTCRIVSFLGRAGSPCAEQGPFSPACTHKVALFHCDDSRCRRGFLGLPQHVYAVGTCTQ